MIAQVLGDGPVQAMCLNGASPHASKYTTQAMSCDGWRDGARGAIDDPHGNPYQGE